MLITRRGLITGIGAVIAAPAIVRASSLMPVRNRLAALEDANLIDALPAARFTDQYFREYIAEYGRSPAQSMLEDCFSALEPSTRIIQQALLSLPHSQHG